MGGAGQKIVWGAECKIKGGGVTPRLTPCLHIVFRNSTSKGLGVTDFAFFQGRLGIYGGVTLYGAYAFSLWVTESAKRKRPKILGEFSLLLRSICLGADRFKARPNIVANLVKRKVRHVRSSGISCPLRLSNSVL